VLRIIWKVTGGVLFGEDGLFINVGDEGSNKRMMSSVRRTVDLKGTSLVSSLVFQIYRHKK
jgi:hypothetical protein